MRSKVFSRYMIIRILLVILFAVMVLRLADIQIAHGQEYKKIAEDKSIRTVVDPAPRGKILDRNGIELASNTQRYSVFMMKPQDAEQDKNLMQIIERLVDILNKDNEKINDSFNIAVTTSGGKYSYEFDFSEDEQTNYSLEQKWKKNNSIPGEYDAEQAFNYLKEVYGINPADKEHDNVPFIRQMMAVRQMIKDSGYMAYKPVELAYVSQSTAFELMEKSLYLPGVSVELKPLRTYPLGELASVVIGGLRKIPAESSQKYTDRDYDISADLIGRNGIEAYAENYLKGTKGERTVTVDATGKIINELSKKDPVSGDNVVLTIDENLQAVAEKSLDTVMQKIRTGDGFKKFPNATRGAAVVIDVKTGEVLAMASRPGGFDPNVMAATGTFDESVRRILYPQKDEYAGVSTERIPKPMFNYATQGAVPPGSTFKMITGIAGIETGKLTPSEIIIDRGRYTGVSGFNGACWLWNEYGGTHGPVNLARALQVSCNYFFFEIGHRVGLDSLTYYADMFGLSNQPTGIEIDENPGNAANKDEIRQTAVALISDSVLKDITSPNYDKNVGTFVPTDEQKSVIMSVLENNDNENSTALSDKLQSVGISSSKIVRRILGGTVQVRAEYSKPGVPLDAAIGQGNDRFTPLQIASYIATLANGGTRYRPHLIKRIVKPDGTVVNDVQPEVMTQLNIKPSTISAIKAGMGQVVDEGGTAAAAFKGFPIKTAGKTGTAQASGGMADYSWFSGFAPADNPQIAVAVVIYEGGGVGASNVARDIYAQYFGLNKN